MCGVCFVGDYLLCISNKNVAFDLTILFMCSLFTVSSYICVSTET